MAFTDIVFSESYARGIWEIPLGTAPGAPVEPGVTMLAALQALYKLDGLDPAAPLVVDNDANTRVAGAGITQTVVTVGNTTTVTRI